MPMSEMDVSGDSLAGEKYLEMKGDEREDECLEILYKVIEHTKSFWVRRFSYVD